MPTREATPTTHQQLPATTVAFTPTAMTTAVDREKHKQRSTSGASSKVGGGDLSAAKRRPQMFEVECDRCGKEFHWSAVVEHRKLCNRPDRSDEPPRKLP